MKVLRHNGIGYTTVKSLSDACEVTVGNINNAIIRLQDKLKDDYELFRGQQLAAIKSEFGIRSSCAQLGILSANGVLTILKHFQCKQSLVNDIMKELGNTAQENAVQEDQNVTELQHKLDAALLEIKLLKENLQDLRSVKEQDNQNQTQMMSIIKTLVTRRDG